jgi:acetolactate synthase-1/2/3 large subunit
MGASIDIRTTTREDISMPATVAQRIVEGLALGGVTHAFAVPGESYLPVLDALHGQQRIRLVTCRHEASATHMAEAAARLSGTCGVAMVTRGPGATQASIGVHTAQQDSTPLLLLVGQVGTDMLGREAFQEIDYRQMFGGIAKQVFELSVPERTPEIVAAALALAQSGRPGPVVLVCPEDVLDRPCAAPPIAPVRPMPAGLADPAPVAELIATAERPILLLGGPNWGRAECDLARRFAEAQGLPVTTSWRRKDRFDTHHPLYVGELGLGANPALVARVKDADLVLAIGPLLGENATQGYTLFTHETAIRALVHIHPDASAVTRTWQPRLAMQAAPGPALAALAELPAGPPRNEWVAELAALHAEWKRPTEVAAGVNPAEIMIHVCQELPGDAIIANGAGNFAAWVHRFHQPTVCGTQLAPVSGAMGYGIPAAIAASILHPEREVVAIAGDGDALMAVAELATIVHEGAAPILIVLDNCQYGTIRMHQARSFPGRPSGTALTNPDFVALAGAFGLHAETVRTTEAFPSAFARARAKRPALIHVLQDRQEIAPGRRLEDGA